VGWGGKGGDGGLTGGCSIAIHVAKPDGMTVRGGTFEAASGADGGAGGPGGDGGRGAAGGNGDRGTQGGGMGAAGGRGAAGAVGGAGGGGAGGGSFGVLCDEATTLNVLAEPMITVGDPGAGGETPGGDPADPGEARPVRDCQ